MWFADKLPEPAKFSVPGFSFAVLIRSSKVLIGLLVGTTIASAVK